MRLNFQPVLKITPDCTGNRKAEVRAWWGVVDSVITRVRSGWSKFTDSVPQYISRGFALRSNRRLGQCNVLTPQNGQIDSNDSSVICRQIV